MFDINSKASVELTVKLGKLHRSALPVAVRGTLNGAAFQAKKLIPKAASRKFITRNKNFFKAFSLVNKAQGFSINSMKSEVGIDPSKGSKVADGLEAQEKGGTILGRKLIPHDKARTSGSHAKKVQGKNKFSAIRFVKPKASSNRSRKANFVAQAVVAAKTGKLVFKKKGSGGTYFRVRSVRFRGTGSSRPVSLSLTPVYHKRRNNITKVKKSEFMKPASILAMKKMPGIYVKEAEKQIKRLMK